MKFSQTVEGCKEALEWLTNTKRIHLLGLEKDTSGYTIVELANTLYEKEKAPD